VQMLGQLLMKGFIARVEVHKLTANSLLQHSTWKSETPAGDLPMPRSSGICNDPPYCIADLGGSRDN